MTNGSVIVTSNIFNDRLQPILLSAGVTGQTPLLSLCYDFHLHTAINNSPCNFPANATGNNGNVFQVLNNSDSTRSATYAYDALNRVSQANTVNTSSSNCWSEIYSIDAWGNLTNRAGASGMGSCYTEGLSATATTQNQLGGLGILYDAAGNVTKDIGGNTLTYDAENRLANDVGYTYAYDAQGSRIEKASGGLGTMYWLGSGGEYLTETDLTGAINAEYIYFNGARIARVDRPSGAVHYYFSDNLGSASVISDGGGTLQERYFYYPYGGLFASIGSDPNHYKFTGKERDTESGLDMFGARYYGSSLGRFMTPDWAAKPVTVPYANFGNPQSLNLYSYVENNPTTTGDPDGHADWYDTNGKRLGTDGVNDGGVVIQKASAVSYSSDHSLIDVAGSGFPVASFSRAEGNAIQSSVDRTLAPAGGDHQGGFHEEGFTVDASGIHNAAPGPAYQQGDATAHINQTINSSTTMEEHTHPVGTQDSAGSTTIGGTHFDPTPSPQDIHGAAGHDNITHVEASAGTSTVYVYNGNGVQAHVPLSAFPRPKKDDQQ